MRIALLAPLVSPICPPFSGGSQAVVYDLAQGLTRRGHAVTLLAAMGSDIPGVRIVDLGIRWQELTPAVFPIAGAGVHQQSSALPPLPPTFILSANQFLRVFHYLQAHKEEFDLVHAHAFDWPSFVFGSLCPVPLVHTVHLPAVDRHINETLRLLNSYPARHELHLLTVSFACAATYSPYCRMDIIYNGIGLDDIPFSLAAGDSLLFAGRIAPEKGVHLALEIARRAGKKLLLAGGIYDRAYFEQQVQPQLASGQAEYLGSLPRAELYALMGKALALLCPIQWEEPFGLVMAEAMATGTPVIAFARGAAPEVIRDGQTGFLIEPDDIGAAVAAVPRCTLLSRQACRDRVELLFSQKAMLDAHEAYYNRLFG